GAERTVREAVQPPAPPRRARGAFRRDPFNQSHGDRAPRRDAHAGRRSIRNPQARRAAPRVPDSTRRLREAWAARGDRGGGAEVPVPHEAREGRDDPRALVGLRDRRAHGARTDRRAWQRAALTLPEESTARGPARRRRHPRPEDAQDPP